MENIEFRICNSVSRINRENWKMAFGNMPEGYEFYKSLEESNLAEFSFYYLLLYSAGRLNLIAPLFISDFNLDIAVLGWLKNAILAIRKLYPRFLIIKTLFVGSPFAEHGVIGLAEDIRKNPKVFDEFVNFLKVFSKEKKAGLTIFKDFPQDKKEGLSALLKNGFFKVNSFPSAINELPFHSLEDYVQSLGPSTRKSLRRKLKSAYSQAKIEIKVLDEADSVIDDLYKLYLNTHSQGGTKFERLTKEFFVSVSRNMQPYIKIFLYYVNGCLGAFNLCFVYKDLFIDKFIGFNYDISNRFHLYFVSWCYNIDWCIKNSVHFYKTGQTDYSAKIKLGGRLLPLYAYFKHGNRGVNILLKFLSLVLKPDNFDVKIKESQP